MSRQKTGLQVLPHREPLIHTSLRDTPRTIQSLDMQLRKSVSAGRHRTRHVGSSHDQRLRSDLGSRRGAVIGIASFGESAPAKDLYAHFGITAQRVVDAVRERVAA